MESEQKERQALTIKLTLLKSRYPDMTILDYSDETSLDDLRNIYQTMYEKLYSDEENLKKEQTKAMIELCKQTGFSANDLIRFILPIFGYSV